MRKFLLFLMAATLLTACSSTQKTTSASKVKAPTPEGQWEYSITDTPEGNFSGIMTVSKNGDGYAASLNTNGNDLPFESFNWNESEKKATGELYYSGTSVQFQASMNEDQMEGGLAAMGMVFPFKAMRKR
ncbi:MAG: hypothetical protein KF725_16400 [Cyclobacteriaceae bacterium]|nr:hypothetical protein [Cyclobacteriaceae bacterium]UYN87171.1 MAG: hypothetical protein KIT51_02525 [Cyclobacteriaceae bacterium]